LPAAHGHHGLQGLPECQGMTCGGCRLPFTESESTGFSLPSAASVMRSESTSAFAEDDLDELLAQLDRTTALVAARYRTLVAKPEQPAETLKRADKVVRRVQLQLRALQHLKVRQTWHGSEGERFLYMYTGNCKRFKSLVDIVRKVQVESRIVRHWRQQAELGAGWTRRAEASQPAQSSFAIPYITDVDLSTWDSLDVFQLDRECQQPLLSVFMSVWRSRKMSQLCKARTPQVVDFIGGIEAAYRQNPYHNRMHAADVMLMSYFLWAGMAAQDNMSGFFTEVDLLVVLLAAAIHDVGHIAVNNDFLVKTRHELAIRYNDRSPLENFHVAFAFEMMKEKGIALLDHNLPSPPVASLRSRIIEMVLATDMARHKQLLEGMAAELEGQANIQDIDKLALEKLLVHVADIGHPLRPHRMHSQWSLRVTQEFFEQGDQEKALGLQVAALFDRDKAPSLAKGQVGFLNFVVIPAWKQLSVALGPAAAEPPQSCLQENLTKWQELSALEDAGATSEELAAKAL